MKAISYFPARDKLLVRLSSIKGTRTRQFGRYKAWVDSEGNVCALAIAPLQEELKEFRRTRGWTQLGGIWKGIDITAEDIKEKRADLLNRLEMRWEK